MIHIQFGGYDQKCFPGEAVAGCDDTGEPVHQDDQVPPQLLQEDSEHQQRLSFVSGEFIQTVVNQAIAFSNCAAEERGEFITHQEYGEPAVRNLDINHKQAFHSACVFLTEYFDGASYALKRENRHYADWADRVERAWRESQQRGSQKPGIDGREADQEASTPVESSTEAEAGRQN